jgi:hypothetical protein
MRADLVTMTLAIVATAAVAGGLIAALTVALRYVARIDRQDDGR